MHKLTTALILGTLLVAMLPHVMADESNPDCENNVKWKDADGNEHTSDQPWIGYTSTAPVQKISDDLHTGLRTCEGEHWDGQDSVSSYHPDETCSVDPSAATGTVSVCMGQNPNNGAADPSTLPVRLRASTQNGDTSKQAYVSTDILLVGRASVYAGQDGKQLTQAVYVRDNTPSNVLATVVSAPGLTKGYVSEADCDQSTYQSGAMTGDRNKCGRDNTAVTLVETLP